MDLSKLTTVKTNNPQEQKFKLKFLPAKESIQFSHQLFAELQLEYNSLSQFKDDKGKDLPVIGVCPGDSGTFYKKRTGNKGKIVKSSRLTQTLLDEGIVKGNIDLVKMGSHNNIEYYTIIQEGANDSPDKAVDPTEPVEMPENVSDQKNDKF